jgi:N12 class adenine-specific DNA methylase
MNPHDTLALFDPHAGQGCPIALPEFDDEDEVSETPAPTATDERSAATGIFHLAGDRPLARGWLARARHNLEALDLARRLETEGRTATEAERLALLCFTGFGASDLAQGVFPPPGAAPRADWTPLAAALAETLPPEELAALRRATQYAHYTPEPVGRALWAAARHLGFAGGRALEPGCGTGLLLALAPPDLAAATCFIGVEACPTTARIARLIHPAAEIVEHDYTRCSFEADFDLVFGNPPFSRRMVEPPRGVSLPRLRLHDHFIAASVARLRPGGVAILVTSTGMLDAADPTAREHIAGTADLLAAVRLPAGAFRATAETEVTTDLLVLRRRAPGEHAQGLAWLRTVPVPIAAEASEPDAPATTEVNELFAAHPGFALGRHTLRRGIYGAGLSYALSGRLEDLEANITKVLLPHLPAGIMPPPAAHHPDARAPRARPARGRDHGGHLRDGSYVELAGTLHQLTGTTPIPVEVRTGRGGRGIAPRDADIIRALLPIRDALRDTLREQAADRPWQDSHARLRIAYGAFLRRFGPINRAEVTQITDKRTGETREIHRRPNHDPFRDDPDAWLVASIEACDPDTNQATPGPALRGRIVRPPITRRVASAADALAVALSEDGRVDLGRIGEILDLPDDETAHTLGALVYRNPTTEAWETADAYLSGNVRAKLLSAREAATIDPTYARNVRALEGVQPADLGPGEISARLGAPWIPTHVVEAFCEERLGAPSVRVLHSEPFATWSVTNRRTAFAGTAAGTSEWGTPRRNAGELLEDALNGAIPQIFDTVREHGQEKRVLNPEATEAAKEKLAAMQAAFEAWVWTDADRATRLCRVYNDRYNNLRVRSFDGSHLQLPGASDAITLRAHQKRAVWRIIASGSTYLAHSVGAGKTMALAAAVMEQRRLGLIGKALVAVPGHTLAQWSREWLALYPQARLLVADEANFSRERRARFLARAATGDWDAIVMTHSAFGLVAVPADFERKMVAGELERLEAAAASLDADDRITRKRLELRKETLQARLEALRDRRDDMLTLAELGVDQLVIDEAQAFRKLAFHTVKGSVKGIDPDGSARAWDLFVKARYVDTLNPGRALIQASGTPITNTLGEMYSLLRFQKESLLEERGIHAFDAWAATFGDTATELELQPSGAYKPVTRFARFVNVPELVDLFRTVADVVLKADLRDQLGLPPIRGGKRRLVAAEPTDAFRAYQRVLAARIAAIEARSGRPQKGDDILLSVITDGRHAAIDLRLVWPDHPDEPDNKLNALIAEVHRIWAATRDRTYPDGEGEGTTPIRGATQMVFSDLGTEAVAATRGFSAYAWIRDELVRRGVPPSEIAIAQDYRRARDKARLQADMRAGRVRIAIGSSEVMGTGVNVQNRLVALHHLDVPWLPALVEQREGRIERQGNLNPEIEIVAYATTGSTDATMWGALERKQRFIEAALSGDRSVRTLEDLDAAQSSQFAIAKAIASGDDRLLEKAGLEAEIARLKRARAAHLDDQAAVRRRLADLRHTIAWSEARTAAIEADLSRRQPTRGDAFRMRVGARETTERRVAGDLLLSRLRMAAREAPPGHAWIAGALGGFELRGRVQPAPGGGRPSLAILRADDFAEEVPLDPALTSAGLVARIEHLLGRFEDDLAEARRRRAEARAQLPAYEARLGAPWPLEDELAERLARLVVLDADLAATP